MPIQLGGLLSGIKRAVIDAHRSVARQHIEELAQFFVAAPGQSPDIKFPDGEWESRNVIMNVPKEVSRNGKVGLENHKVHVPLITLLPLKSHVIDRVEVLTTLDLSLASLSDEALKGNDDLAPDILVGLGGKGPHSAEIKIVVHGVDLPAGYARLVGAYEKLLNAQLPT
ncbi:MAG: DUF2589 domain-containing protein [Telluria sp.]